MYLTQPYLQLPRQFTLTNYPKTRVITPLAACGRGVVAPLAAPLTLHQPVLKLSATSEHHSSPPSISLGVTYFTPNCYLDRRLWTFFFAMISTSAIATATAALSSASPLHQVTRRSYKEKANSNRPIGPYKAVRYLT